MRNLPDPGATVGGVPRLNQSVSKQALSKDRRTWHRWKQEPSRRKQPPPSQKLELLHPKQPRGSMLPKLPPRPQSCNVYVLNS